MLGNVAEKIADNDQSGVANVLLLHSIKIFMCLLVKYENTKRNSDGTDKCGHGGSNLYRI